MAFSGHRFMTSGSNLQFPGLRGNTRFSRGKALVDAEMVFGVVEGGFRERVVDGFGQGTIGIVDQEGSLIKR